MDSKPERPIVICGASLAGSACAIRLVQLGYPVILIDKAVFPRPKLCGEFLGPDAMPALQTLEVLDTIKTASGGVVETIRLYNLKGQSLPVQIRWIRKDYPFALAIPRETLDSIVLEKARASGVTILENQTVTNYKQNSNGLFEIFCQGAKTQMDFNSEKKIVASIFIDASGRNSRLSAMARREDVAVSKSLNTAISRQVGLQCHITHQSLTNDLSMFFFPGGYGGLQPISRDIANLCVWVQPDLAKLAHKDFNAFLETGLFQNVVARKLLKDVKCLGKLETVSGIRQLHARNPAKPILSIGDALLAVEPFSGFGMAHALQTGILAAEHIAQGLQQGHHYQKIHAGYLKQYYRQFDSHLRILKWARPLLNARTLQNLLWPILPPFMPLLTSLYR